MIRNIKLLKTGLRKYKKAVILFIIFIVVGAYPLYALSSYLQHCLNFNASALEPGQTVNSTINPKIIIYENITGQRNLKEIVTQAISKASKSIHIAIYSFDLEEIKEELIKANLRGVYVEIFVTYEKKEQIEDLFGENPGGLNITYIGEEMEGEVYNMHHKFMVIDPETVHETLITGPWNWTKYQEELDPNMLLEIHDHDIIASYMDEIQRLGNNGFSYGKFKNNYHPWAKKIIYPNGDTAEIWFSPGRKQNGIQDKILEMIKSSTKSIDIAVTIFDADRLAEEIIKKAKQGVKVRILTNKGSENVYETNINRLLEAKNELQLDSLEILFEGTAPTNKETKYSIFHHNYIIVDEKAVLTGTANWTYSGFFINDENAIVFYSPQIAAQFTDIFSQYVL